jgi:ATP-dependent Lon protease
VEGSSMAINTCPYFESFSLTSDQAFSFSSLIQPVQIALKLVRQGVSNGPPRDITIVEAKEDLASFDVAIKVEDEKSKDSLAKDASVDVNPIDSSLENINAIPLTTESEIGHNEHSNEDPIEKNLQETTKLFNTSSAQEVI